MEKIKTEKSVLYMYQIKNNAARQEREQGYCEVVVGGFESHSELFEEIKKLFANFFKNSQSLDIFLFKRIITIGLLKEDDTSEQ